MENRSTPVKQATRQKGKGLLKQSHSGRVRKTKKIFKPYMRPEHDPQFMEMTQLMSELITQVNHTYTACSHLFTHESVGIESKNQHSTYETVPGSKKSQREKENGAQNSPLKKYKEETTSEFSDIYGKLDMAQ